MSSSLILPLRPFSRRCATAVTIAAWATLSVTAAQAQSPALREHAGMTIATPGEDDDNRSWKTALGGLPVPGSPPAIASPASLRGRWSASPHSLRDSIVVSLARTAVGTRYLRGGQSRQRGFDCSGLVRYIMIALEVEIPRTSRQQSVSGVAVERDTAELRPGDLLAFAVATRHVSHVGVYIGDGRYVHASSVAGRVIESRIDRPGSPLVKSWRGARRLLPRGEPVENAAG